ELLVPRETRERAGEPALADAAHGQAARPGATGQAALRDLQVERAGGAVSGGRRCELRVGRRAALARGGEADDRHREHGDRKQRDERQEPAPHRALLPSATTAATSAPAANEPSTS